MPFSTLHEVPSVYAEDHRTMGDWVSLIGAAEFTIDSVTEPEWPESNQTAWAAGLVCAGRSAHFR